VLKTQAAEDLVRAIDEVSRGAVYISPAVAVSLVDAIVEKDESPNKELSARERQILQLIAESKSTKEIARMLDISYKTAESHRSRLMKKLDIHETTGLVRYANPPRAAAALDAPNPRTTRTPARANAALPRAHGLPDPD